MIKIVPTPFLRLREAFLRATILLLATRREALLADAGKLTGRITALQKKRNAVTATIASRYPADRLLACFVQRPL